MVKVNLKNKTILISGGANGVGREFIGACIDMGANIIVIDHDAEEIENYKKFSKYNPNLVKFINCDLNSTKELDQTLNYIENNFNQIDGFVNYAGITNIASILDTTDYDYDSVMTVNLKSAFFIAQRIIKMSLKNKNPSSFVFIGSPHYKGGEINRAAYAISKGALFTLSNHISKNYSQNNIRSNYVILGWTLTKGEISLRKKHNQDLNEVIQQANNKIPIGRMPVIQDSIFGILYLLSNESSMVTGSIIDVSGGMKI